MVGSLGGHSTLVEVATILNDHQRGNRRQLQPVHVKLVENVLILQPLDHQPAPAARQFPLIKSRCVPDPGSRPRGSVRGGGVRGDHSFDRTRAPLTTRSDGPLPGWPGEWLMKAVPGAVTLYSRARGAACAGDMTQQHQVEAPKKLRAGALSSAERPGRPTIQSLCTQLRASSSVGSCRQCPP